MEKILITGGAGYVGSVLLPLLLQNGYKVRVLDNLMYGGQSLLPHFANPNFEFIKGDICKEAIVSDAMRDVDVIVHLAAIVGFPACRKFPQLAKEVNVGGTKNIAKHWQKGQLVIFASTGSNYGALVDEICTEEMPLNPLSLYGKTKVVAEQHLLENCDTIAFRFATGFGVSPRLRLDLLINDFVYQAVKVRHLVVYERDFMRSFIHVYDMARAFLFGIENADRMKNNVYNMGSKKMNYSKEDICNMLRKRHDFYLHFADFGKDLDQRNYVVCYDKIHSLGYDTTVTVQQGIDELIRAMNVIDIKNPHSNI